MITSLSGRLRGLAAALLTLALLFGGAVAQNSVRESVREPVRVAVYNIVDVDVTRDGIHGFESALRAAGIDGLEITHFDAQGQANLFPLLARRIVASEPDLIAVIGTPVVLATAEATGDIPIVFIAMGDPVGAGVAASLERPGGNATGTTDWIPPSDTLDVVRATLPAVRRIGTLYDPSNQNGEVFHRALVDAADAAGVDLVDLPIASSGEVFTAARSLVGRVDAIVIGPDAAVVQATPALASVAQDAAVPLFMTAGSAEEPGVLMNLGVDYERLGEIAGEQAARILRGADPAELPIVGMDAFAVEVNEATRAALGLELPAALAGATRID